MKQYKFYSIIFCGYHEKLLACLFAPVSLPNCKELYFIKSKNCQVCIVMLFPMYYAGYYRIGFIVAFETMQFLIRVRKNIQNYIVISFLQ